MNAIRWSICLSFLLLCTMARAASYTLRLEENPTTGYLWSYTMEPQGVLVETASAFETTGRGMAGAPGVRVFTLAPATEGDVVLRFELRRPWEADVPPLDTRTYRLSVSMDGIREQNE
ncbi:MAG: protease inhibitor I42 family protein [Verrucomicrobiota bacterium]|jgi:inhibitor of cysteine peptidase|nr:protease inhibitor I42 family protein [Verrucomicrobiota bacterium]